MLFVLLSACDALPDRRAGLWATANDAHAAGDLRESRRHFEALVAWDPRDIAAAEALARMSRSQNQPAVALQWIDGVPSDVRRSDAQRRLRAELLLEAGRVPAAAVAWAALPPPMSTELLSEPGWLKTIAHSGFGPKRLAGFPKEWGPGIVDALIKEGRWANAWRWLERIETTNPRREALLVRLQESVLALEGDLADPWFHELAVAGTGADGTLLERRLALEKGDRGAARAAARRFLEGYPDDPRRGSLLLDEARALLAGREAEAALEAIREAHRLDSGSPSGALLEARALKWLDREDEARHVLEDAREAFPDDPATEAALARWREPAVLDSVRRDIEFRFEVKGGDQ